MSGATVVRSGAATTGPAIAPVVDQFRADLGPLNANVAGSFPNGRREINWDGVPDNLAAPNNLPANFFNTNSPRGVVFATPGTGFQVSADSSNPTGTPVEFGHINPAYPNLFAPFSAQRLFTPVASNIVDVTFFVPGSGEVATVTGFGAVFSDVDFVNTTRLIFFDAAGNSLGTFFVPNVAGNETFSFLGVSFNAGERVARVRMICGNQILGSGNNTEDLVVMDDLIYGEPQSSSSTATPTPSPTPTATPTPSPTASPTPTATAVPTKLVNISTRVRVDTGDNVLIGGFILDGIEQKRLILRALGPSLPVDRALTDPRLDIYDANRDLVASNDDWQQAPNAQEIADSTVAPANVRESAVLRTFTPGSYTAVLSGVDNGTGAGLVEVYDLQTGAESQLANISTRGLVQTGDDVMIGGLIVAGSTARKVIVRAIGPSLPVSGSLADPTLELFNANGDSVGFNDNWRSDQAAEIIATTVPPSDEAESAIVRTLTPAAYTAVVRGVNEGTGVALVEVYALVPGAGGEVPD